LDLLVLGVGAGAIVVYAVVSGRLSRRIISGPLFFAVVGVVAVALGLGRTPTGDVTGLAQVALEVTAALVPFTDAMPTNLSSWREKGRLPAVCSASACR
jgi:hypothetical protein